MISIVLVSHSETLAKGVLELIQQMVQDQVPIALAAGTDNPDEPIGTDPMKVMAAIESVYSEDGVLVLMDLGSAVMSAEAAIEFLEPAQQPHIYLCEVPLVEGGLAAAVSAVSNSSIESVIAEARDALGNKTEQLTPILRIPPLVQASQESIPSTPSIPSDEPTAQRTIILPNQLGIHARPAAKIVTRLASFDANVQIQFKERLVNAHSLNKLVTLGARYGDELVFLASGPEAEEALAAMESLAGENFGDIDAPVNHAASNEGEEEGIEDGAEASSSSTVDRLRGIPASPGIGIGPLYLWEGGVVPTVEERHVDDVEAEKQRLNHALNSVQEQLTQLEAETTQSIGADEAAIFHAHRLMLTDPDLIEQLDTRFEQSHLNAEAIWQQTIQATVDSYLALDDPYLRERAVDLDDVGQRVLRHLCGESIAPLTLSEPVILVASDIHPSDAAQLPVDQVLGILLKRGGATSHSAILARSLGIPALVGLGTHLDHVRTGQIVGFNGTSGQLWIEPDDQELQAMEAERIEWLAQQQKLVQAALQPTFTRDGERVEVAANIGTSAEATNAAEAGAEGVGLYRSEFLFMNRDNAPSEDEQVAAYIAAAQAFGPPFEQAPVIIRTLDVGGDKPIDYLEQPQEENPFLGWRGIRFCLGNLSLFKTQLRALLRAGAAHNIKVMLPMVNSVDEVRQTRALLQDIQSELMAEGIGFNRHMELGIMVETPAAVWSAAHLAQEVDFFSIGTNDLTQYIMAADRGNANVAEQVTPFQPAVLQAIHHVVVTAHSAGIWVGMCGELAGNPLATPLLIGLGLDELSMSAPAIPQIKQSIRTLTQSSAQAIANQVLKYASAQEVETYLQNVLDGN
ncbi:MAG: phosphoenolpyruvate--protein phosphotransferase [Chloroflexota bacterium]